jgi:hypothetical protein
MHLRHGRQLAGMADMVGAACAYAIILGMLATALAPLVIPLFQN